MLRAPYFPSVSFFSKQYLLHDCVSSEGSTVGLALQACGASSYFRTNPRQLPAIEQARVCLPCPPASMLQFRNSVKATPYRAPDDQSLPIALALPCGESKGILTFGQFGRLGPLFIWRHPPGRRRPRSSCCCRSHFASLSVSFWPFVRAIPDAYLYVGIQSLGHGNLADGLRLGKSTSLTAGGQ